MYPINRVLSTQIACSVTNVPTVFSTAAGSKVLTGLANSGRTLINILNLTSQVLGCVNIDDDAGTPSTSSTEKFYVPANGFIVLDGFPLFNNLFIQAEGTGTTSASTISSGKIFIVAGGSK